MLQILVSLMFFSAILVGLAQRLHIPYPIALVFGGLFIGFIPGIPAVTFDPNALLLTVLPPILYYSSIAISFREFRKNWREIFSLALGLVGMTTLVVGFLFKWMFPQYSWALAFTFGAIVSPPDAIAATAVLRRFKIKSRLLSILEGESLVNDASAIVLYRMGVVALLSGSFSVAEASYAFVTVVLGGIAVGLILGLLIQSFSRHYFDPAIGVLFSFTIPYTIYIAADFLEVSGVLAVVVAGLIGSRNLLAHASSLRRILGFATWDIFVIGLNCFVFILIGLYLRTFADWMSVEKMWGYFGYALLVSGVMVLVRMSWMFTTRSINMQESALIGWSGMRGIVSLTASLALPLAVEGREQLIFITFAVILITLVVPGLTLPALIRWLDMKPDEEEEGAHHVGKMLSKIADDKLVHLHEKALINDEEFEVLRTYFKLQRRLLGSSNPDGTLHPLEGARLKVIQEQRKQLVGLWKKHQIGDKLLLEFEQYLDVEENHRARADLI